MSNFFPVENGIRQCCPFSPYLFIISIELLSHKISTSETIKGIQFIREEFKKSLFADDASFILYGSFKSFEQLIDVLRDNFNYISGLKLNEQKCTFNLTWTKNLRWMKEFILYEKKLSSLRRNGENQCFY